MQPQGFARCQPRTPQAEALATWAPEPSGDTLRVDFGWTTERVPEGTIFVMGDNRAHSADSTAHMCGDTETDCVPGDEFVPVDLVVGKVFVLLWPRSHFRWVHRPDTFANVPDAPE